MTEDYQSAEALTPQSITKSVTIQSEGRCIQIAYLILQVPGIIPDHQMRRLEMGASSMMRQVASAIDSALYGESQ